MATYASVRYGLSAALMLALWTSQALAADVPASATAADVVQRDPNAVAALNAMGRALRGLDHFTLKSDSSIDVVLETGQKIQLDGGATYRARRPDGLFVELKSDRKLRRIYYDGKALTIHAPKQNFFATVSTQAHTIGELATNAERDYGIALPLADLFYWGTTELSTDVLTSALYIGPALLDGRQTEQYAFRQPGVDWQVWIASDDHLPQKIVITNAEDPALPEFRAQLHWDTTSPVPASTFRFDAPKGAASIVLTLPAASGDKK